MFKQLAIAGAVAAGLAFALPVTQSANALPTAKAPVSGAQSGNLILARDGRGGGGGRVGGGFGGGRAFSGGGGGGRSFRGGGGGGGRAIVGGGFGGQKFSGSRSFNGRSGNWNGGGGGRHHGRHNNRRFYGGGYGYYPYYGASYYSDYGYGSDCGWLRRRAVNTGSSYWWRRYEQCVSDY